MATKDWKKTSKQYYDEWKNKDRVGRLTISENLERYSYKIKNYSLYAWSRDTDNPQIFKLFKTKSKALAYAKAYMRKH